MLNSVTRNIKKPDMVMGGLFIGLMIIGFAYFYVPSLMITVLLITVGVIFYGLFLGRMYRLGREDGAESVKVDQENDEVQSSYERMLSNSHRALKKPCNLQSRAVEKDPSAMADLEGLYSLLAGFVPGVFYSSNNQSKP